MRLSRVKTLGIILGLIGCLLCKPTSVFSWASFSGHVSGVDVSEYFYGNTHALIVKEAMARLNEDPTFQALQFLDTQSIISFDSVSVLNLHPWTTSGTGPDSDGASKYSEHYYNPKTEQGGGPDAVAKHFKNLIMNIGNGKYGAAASKSAAWAAHFLSDMHVPYHVVGIPASEAHKRQRMNLGNLSLAESGPSILYGATPIPYGWGSNQGFDKALYRFTAYNPEINGEIGTTDWYDPWYLNGEEVIQATSMLDGSHANWEKKAHKLWTQGAGFDYLNSLLNESTWDPEWENTILQFSGNKDPWQPVNQGMINFAKACALETRNKLEKDWATPWVSTSRAIRAVMTMYRASVTAIKIEPIMYKRRDNKHYKATCSIVNTNRSDTLQNVKIMFLAKKANGKKLYKAVQLNQDIRPLARDSALWNIPVKNNETIHLDCAVTGLYQNTPDLGYNVRSITFKVGNAPEPCPGPEPNDPNFNAPLNYSGSQCPDSNPDPSKYKHRFDTNNNPGDQTYIDCQYYKDGYLQTQIPYTNGKFDGVRLGYIKYNECGGRFLSRREILRNGKKVFVWNFLCNKKTGNVYKFYMASYSDGMLTNSTKWYSNGVKSEYSEYKANGSGLALKEYYNKEGKMTSCKQWDSKGYPHPCN